MSLGELFDRFDEAIGRGDSVSALRNQLAVIREQVEAVEAQLESAQLRVQDLQVKIKGGKLDTEQGELDEGAIKLLQLFSIQRAPSLEQAARELGFSKVKSEYHANALVGSGMIELAAYHPGKGMMYIVTPKGTAYLIENKLAN